MRIVVFATSDQYFAEFHQYVDFVREMKCNRYGTPIFRYMMMHIESHYSFDYYGYCNGDLLIHSSLLSALDFVSEQIAKGLLDHRVAVNRLNHLEAFLVGRRTNIFAPFPRLSRSHRAQNDAQIAECSKRGSLFQSDAEDYFVFTRHTFDWQFIKDVVIGRPGYDNYLVSQVYHNRTRNSFIDITNAVIVAHQTDSDGVKAGHRKSKDRFYNMKLIKRDWKKGRIEYSDFVLEQFPVSSFAIRRRFYVPDIPFDDSFLLEELSLLRRFIRPSDVCVELASRVVRGVLSELCRKLYVVVYRDFFVP